MIPGDRFPHDKETLLSEVDARLRIGDIRRSHQLKERLSPKWWEAGVIMLLFASALGLLASLFQYSNVRTEPLNTWLLFWFTLMILTIVLSFEILLVKIYNLRRSNEILLRMIDDLQKQADELNEKISARGEPNEPKN